MSSSGYSSGEGSCTRAVEFGKLILQPNETNHDLINLLHRFPNSCHYNILIKVVDRTTSQYIMAITDGWKDKMAWPRLITFMVVVFLLLTTVGSVMKRRGALDLPANGHPGNEIPQEYVVVHTWCPVPQLPAPSQDGLISLADFGDSKDLIKQQVERLSAAVNVPTISYDDSDDVDKDPRWHAFVTLHDVLKAQFPRVYANIADFTERVLTFIQA
jgi:hypothetical protein